MQAQIGKDLTRAIALLNAGEVVAIPTETVYGLAGNALSEVAVRKIFAIKERPLHNPLIVHLAAAERLGEVARAVPPLAWRLMEAFSPGPLTLLLPKTDRVPDLVTAGLPRVAVRIPAHPLALELLASLEFPLTAPSANPYGYISPTAPGHVLRQLGERIFYILDGGPCACGIESTVVGFEDGRPVIHRLGALSAEAIVGVVGDVRVRDREATAPPGPGMLPFHYAPATPLVGAACLHDVLKRHPPEAVGVIALAERRAEIPDENQILLSPSGDLEEAARNLYAALHELDGRGLRVIVAERLPDTGMGRAINDRLMRAAAK